MKLLITGGFGYLGGRLSQSLSEQKNYDIFLGSRECSEPPVMLPLVNTVKTEWDILTSYDKITDGMDAIVHLSGMNALDCVKNPVAALAVNGLTTARLLDSAIRNGVKRFIYLSSAHVYGSPLSGVITEESCPKATHPYATSHRAGEDVVIAAHQRGDINGIVIRLSNSFGAPIHIETNCWMLLVNDLCRQAIRTKQMVLQSSGKQKRNFITLTNVCRAIKYLLELPHIKLGNGIFNVGSDWNPTILEITQLLAVRIGIQIGNTPEIILQNDQSQNIKNVEFLDYRMQKLLDTGYEHGGDVNKELDGLVQFCAEQFNQLTV